MTPPETTIHWESIAIESHGMDNLGQPWDVLPIPPMEDFWLVGQRGFWLFLFSHILGIRLPTDYKIVFRGVQSTNQVLLKREKTMNAVRFQHAAGSKVFVHFYGDGIKINNLSRSGDSTARRLDVVFRGVKPIQCCSGSRLLINVGKDQFTFWYPFT